MKLDLFNPAKKLKASYQRLHIDRDKIELFKENIKQSFQDIAIADKKKESEEHYKAIIRDFLLDTYYKGNHSINTQGRNDLVIHNGSNATSPVGIIIETKQPSNKSEMISAKNPNSKSFQQLITYFLKERFENKNLEIKHLIISNIYEWYIFDASDFERYFYDNKKIKDSYLNWTSGASLMSKTDWFYKEVLFPHIEENLESIPCTYFNLKDYESIINNDNLEDDEALLDLYKILSPEHLLKKPIANDSNSLNKQFYAELLHILGLEEVKEGSKKTIKRCAKPNEGSLLENTLNILRKEFEEIKDKDEQYSIALELCLTWLNRILFLKLLEGQLIKYNNSIDFAFLNYKLIKDFDELEELFFEVLAEKYSERSDSVNKKFGNIPYLNSSLFEKTELEKKYFRVNSLKDRLDIPVYKNTVLLHTPSPSQEGSFNKRTLEYLFEFLDAYDFGDESKGKIKENSKSIINASVLGLIFEKINGYKDGSFFTPSFITMYMCRESIRRAVIQKFNDTYYSLLEEGKGGVMDGIIAQLHTPDPSQEGRKSRRTIIPYNPALKELARNLRNNSTKSEIILWRELKGKYKEKYDFHRQKPLDNFIADFYCYELNLVVELDGITHDWEETQQKDFQKEVRLNELGINVLRFQDGEVFNHLAYVLDTISQYIEGYQKGDLSEFKREDTPLNPLSRGNFAIAKRHTPNPSLVHTPDPSQGHTPSPSQEGNDAVFKTIIDVRNEIGAGKMFSKVEANKIINTLRICDPAVGSGHFLVSALNELITIKQDLKILIDSEGVDLSDYTIDIENDELVIMDDRGNLFEYTPPTPLKRGEMPTTPFKSGEMQRKESQRIQETLFREKQTIIENCLFGVDINPKSVMICRLRLWIELLKNAYYKHTPNPSQEGNIRELQTLPNIDINIKCGNSLISRFEVKDSVFESIPNFQTRLKEYTTWVQVYKGERDKSAKAQLVKKIDQFKSEFKLRDKRTDKVQNELDKVTIEILKSKNPLFPLTDSEKSKVKDYEAKLEKLTQEKKDIESNPIYQNAFEWRFEFPEVLDENGGFVGFDVVIGNPPYGVKFMDSEKNYFKDIYNEVHIRTLESYNYFIYKFSQISSNNSICNLIIPSSFLNQTEFEKTRNLILDTKNLSLILNLGDEVFEDVATPTCIFSFNSYNINTIIIYNDLTSILRSDLSISLDTGVEFIEKSEFIGKSNSSFIHKKNTQIAEKCFKNNLTLKDLAEDVATGVSPGLGEAFVVNNKFANETKIEKKILKKLIIGGEINKYFLNPKSEKFLIYLTAKTEIAEFPNCLNHLANYRAKLEERVETKNGTIPWYVMLRPRRIKLFETPKILIRQTANKIIATYDESNWYCLKSGIIIQLPSNSELDYKYLLGVINSKLMDYLYKNLVNEENRIFPEVKPIQLFKLPIVKANNKIQKPIINLVDKILSFKKNTSPALLKEGETVADTSDLEAEIDKLVYELYGLSVEEIAIIENK